MEHFEALERIRIGNVGLVEPGQPFEVFPDQARQLQRLVDRGIIRRSPQRIDVTATRPLEELRALVGYENKAISPEQNKRLGSGRRNKR